jgi:hypothetical protein
MTKIVNFLPQIVNLLFFNTCAKISIKYIFWISAAVYPVGGVGITVYAFIFKREATEYGI